MVIGDLLDLNAVRAAMEGVSSAYFCYTAFFPGLSHATAIFAQAAKEAGLVSKLTKQTKTLNMMIRRTMVETTFASCLSRAVK